jgi:hypothetical protein
VAKVCKRLFKKVSYRAKPSMIMRVSSAYWMIGKSEVNSRGMGSFSKFMSLALLTSVCKKSAARTKSKGENGSPCLTPLLQWNVLPGTPLRRTTEVHEEKTDDIQCNHFFPLHLPSAP